MTFSIFRQWKNLSYGLNTFENIMENGAFAPKRANAPFSIICANT